METRRLHIENPQENLDLMNHMRKIPHQVIPVIIDFAEKESQEYADMLKSAGIPFIIRGVRGWAKFSYKWLKQVSEDRASCSKKRKPSSSASASASDDKSTSRQPSCPRCTVEFTQINNKCTVCEYRLTKAEFECLCKVIGASKPGDRETMCFF